jgi:superfamily I DNA/RNA helicase
MIGVKQMSRYILTDEQNGVVSLAKEGHWLIKGAAGTGKSTVAMARAEYLTQQQDLFVPEECLVLAYNNLVTKYLRREANTNDQIESKTFHYWALDIIRNYYRNNGNTENSKTELDQMWTRDEHEETKWWKRVTKAREWIQKAILQVQSERAVHPVFDRTLEEIAAEIEFIQVDGLVDEDDYINAKRRGFANKFDKSSRELIHQIYRKYREVMVEEGFQGDINSIALELYNLYKSSNPPKYTVENIIIDECQDFTPMMLKSVACVSDNIMLLGDAAQQIYGKDGVPWKRAGINIVGRTRELKQNFRNCLEIYNFAQDIKANPLWFDEGENIPVENVNTESVRADDSSPISLNCLLSKEDEDEYIVNYISEKPQFIKSIVLIVRNHFEFRAYQNLLETNGLESCVLTKENEFPEISQGVFIATMYSVKGLEFDAVIIPAYNKLWGINSWNIEELDGAVNVSIYEAALKLFYTAITRARYQIILTCTEQLSLTFPYYSENYQMVGEESPKKVSELCSYMKKSEINVDKMLEKDVARRNIQHLIHFTAVDNLETVLQNGLHEKMNFIVDWYRLITTMNTDGKVEARSALQ